MKTNLLENKTKAKLFTIAVLAITVATLASTTLAYFTAENTAHNVITTSGVDIEIKEWAEVEKKTEFPEEGISGVMPGTEVTKIVEIENKEADAWVRVWFEIKVEGNDKNELDATEVSLITGEDWEKHTGKDADGKDIDYYYYKLPLQAGTTSTPALKSVQFKPTMGNEYQNSKVEVIVHAEAIQVANMTPEAMASAGWHYMGTTTSEE